MSALDPVPLVQLAVQADAEPTGFANMLPMWIGLGLIFWFVLIRPERKERKRKQAMIDNLKKNDRVVTTSGILAKVASLTDAHVVLQLDQGRAKVLKSAIATVVEDEDETNDESKDSKGGGR